MVSFIKGLVGVMIHMLYTCCYSFGVMFEVEHVGKDLTTAYSKLH